MVDNLEVMEKAARKKVTSRRTILAGLGAAGVAAGLYNLAPSFWRQFTRELRRPVAPPPLRPNPRAWPHSGLHAAWLGHATVLLKIDGFTILTDPVFSTRAGLNLGPLTLGVKRLVAPALEPEDLPHIDLILLSHAHMDHLDVPSLRQLEHQRTQVITARSTSDLFRPERYMQTVELGWDERVRMGPAEFRAFRVNHWGARMRNDRHRGYNAYVIETGRYRVLFAGDTAITDAFRNVRGRRPFDLAIVPIGAYNPWIRYHCTPEEAWKMGNDARAERFIPVHHQTFQLSREPHHEPIERFQNAAGNQPERVAIRRIGQECRA